MGATLALSNALQESIGNVKLEIQTILKIVVSLVALAVVVLVLRGVDLAVAWGTLRMASPIALALALAAQAFGIYLRLVRWREMLRPSKLVPIRGLVSPLLIYCMMSNVTLSGLGVVPRVYLVNRRTGVESGFIVGTWLQEYLLDVTALLLWAVVGPFLVNAPPQFRQIQMALAAPLLALLVIDIAVWRRAFFLVGFLKRRGWWDAIATRLPGNAGAHLNGVADGLTASLCQPRNGWRVILATVAIWAAEPLQFWFLIRSLTADFGVLEMATVMSYIYVVTGLPSVPGFIGTLEASTVSIIVSLGGSQALALSYAVLVRVLFLGPTTAAGLLLAWREGWSVRGLLTGKGATYSS